MKKSFFAILLFCATSLFADDNVVIILDASGSMKETFSANRHVSKMDGAKSALIKVIANIPEQTNIGLVVFSSYNLTDDWVFHLGKINKDNVYNVIRRIEPYGGTPLGKYLKIGADELLQQRAKEHGYGTYRLLVVTDGEAGDQHLVNRYLPEINARGIKVDVIGVDMDEDIPLAKIVNSYRTASNPEKLESAVSSVLGEVKVGNDNFQDDVSDYLNGFQDQESVQKVIDALIDLPNYPIGDKPPRNNSFSTNQNPSETKLNLVSGIILIIVVILIFSLVVFVLVNFVS